MKSPAFQFYASDFYMDTISWSEEMIGLHIRLMCIQWINGTIENEGEYPAGLSEKNKVVFDKIKHKYSQEKSGNFFNKRLEKIKKSKDEFVKNARKTGKDGALKRWGKDRVPHENHNGVNLALQSSVFSLQSSTEINISFDVFWGMYDKKRGDTKKIKKKWEALTDKERETILAYLPGYKKSQPDKQFRKDPATFLNNRSWCDELLNSQPQQRIEDWGIDQPGMVH